MPWQLSENAKLVRKVVYGQFLSRGSSNGTGPLLEETGLTPDELTAAIAELERGLMVMCLPGTHEIAKCPPWTNFPTRHAIEIDGERVCYAGCIFEAVNIIYCYPGKDITIRSCCPQTGEEIAISLRGKEVLASSPSRLVGHIGVDPGLWSNNWFRACANANLFVSSDAVATWESAHPDLKGVTLTLPQLVQFARYENRLDYERPADPTRGPQSAEQFVGWLGVEVPEYWR